MKGVTSPSQPDQITMKQEESLALLEALKLSPMPFGRRG